MKKIFTLLFCGFAFIAANAQVDLAIDEFVDNVNDQNPITTLNLGMNDDLNPVCVLSMKSGALQATDTVYFDISVNDQTLGSLFNLGGTLTGAGLSTEAPLLIYGQNPLMTAAQMNQNNITGTFNLCYTVRVVGTTDTDNSNDKACLTIVRGSNSIDGFNAEAINVYPNPAANVINVANAENAQVAVFDINGKLMVSVENASANQTIDASNFANGLYFVRITDGNNVITKKINVVK